MLTQPRFEPLTLSLPSHWLLALEYDDTSCMSRTETEAFARWRRDTINDLGTWWHTSIGEDEFFARYHDATEYGVPACMCHDVTLMLRAY